MGISSTGSAENETALAYRGYVSGTVRKRIDRHYESGSVQGAGAHRNRRND